MSKLLSLKDWVTLDEAARHLSGVFNEDVSVGDLYRFALSGRLILSANFVNRGRAYLGQKLRIRDAGFKVRPDEGDDPEIRLYLTADAMPEFEAWLNEDAARKELLSAVEPKVKLIELDGDQLSETECLRFDGKISKIEGVWDLSMNGAERLDIEQALQKEVGGPDVKLICLGGVLLCRSDGTYARLLEHFNKSRDWGDHQAYVPAGAIPEDAPIVVRPQALSNFVEFVARGEIPEKPMDERERTTLLRIIRALGAMSKLPGRGASSAVQKQLQILGFQAPGEATVRKKLEEARALEPDNKAQ